MEEAVVYRKEMITAGLDADTQTPAEMRHRSVGSVKLSRAVLTWNRRFFSNSRPFADKDLAVTTELNDGTDAIKGSRQREKKPHFFLEKLQYLLIVYHTLLPFSKIGFRST